MPSPVLTKETDICKPGESNRRRERPMGVMELPTALNVELNEGECRGRRRWLHRLKFFLD